MHIFWRILLTIQNLNFRFYVLTVSGGHTQIVLVKDYFDMEIVGETLMMPQVKPLIKLLKFCFALSWRTIN